MNTQFIRKLYQDVRGANMVEYIILVGVVALLAVAAFRAFGNSINKEIGNQGSAVDGINSSSTVTS